MKNHVNLGWIFRWETLVCKHKLLNQYLGKGKLKYKSQWVVLSLNLGSGVYDLTKKGKQETQKDDKRMSDVRLEYSL